MRHRLHSLCRAMSREVDLLFFADERVFQPVQLHRLCDWRRFPGDIELCEVVCLVF